MQPRIEVPAEFSPGALVPEHIAAQYLKHCGGGARIYKGCRLVSGASISIGECSQIDEGVYIFGGDGVTLGRNVHLAFASSISGGGLCEIGDFAGIGAGVRIITGTDLVDGSGLTNPTVPPELRAVQRGKVVIGAHAVIFTNTVVLPNVTIGAGAVVAAGSVVHKDLKPWMIYAGHPLVAIGERPKDQILKRGQDLLF